MYYIGDRIQYDYPMDYIYHFIHSDAVIIGFYVGIFFHLNVKSHVKNIKGKLE